jgi:hypothetical protein
MALLLRTELNNFDGSVARVSVRSDVLRKQLNHIIFETKKERDPGKNLGRLLNSCRRRK